MVASNGSGSRGSGIRGLLSRSSHGWAKSSIGRSLLSALPLARWLVDVSLSLSLSLSLCVRATARPTRGCPILAPSLLFLVAIIFDATSEARVNCYAASTTVVTETTGGWSWTFQQGASLPAIVTHLRRWVQHWIRRDRHQAAKHDSARLYRERCPGTTR